MKKEIEDSLFIKEISVYIFSLEDYPSFHGISWNNFHITTSLVSKIRLQINWSKIVVSITDLYCHTLEFSTEGKIF